MTAWDEMTIAKNFPGIAPAPYVAGMNVLGLPNMNFTVSNTLIEAKNLNGGD